MTSGGSCGWNRPLTRREPGAARAGWRMIHSAYIPGNLARSGFRWRMAAHALMAQSVNLQLSHLGGWWWVAPPAVPSCRTSRTGVSRHRGQFRCVLSRAVGNGVSQVLEDSWARACGDVKSPAGNHRSHYREAPGQRGGAKLWRRPVLDIRPVRALPHRGRGGVRAAVPAAEERRHYVDLGRRRSGDGYPA